MSTRSDPTRSRSGFAGQPTADWSRQLAAGATTSPRAGKGSSVHPTTRPDTQVERRERTLVSSRKARQARRCRDAAAARYKPKAVELLLIAEAPPAALDRYFYFEDVPDQDSLFRHVVRAVLALDPSRSEKPDQLRRLADRGVFLIDLKPEPKLPDETLELYVADLVTRAVEVRPRHVITIKTNVCELTQSPLDD
jgi:hypothetical protein